MTIGTTGGFFISTRCPQLGVFALLVGAVLCTYLARGDRIKRLIKFGNPIETAGWCFGTDLRSEWGFMNNGWIKLHRKIINKAFSSKPAYLSVWIHLLLSANHAPKEFMWNGNVIIVKEGQLITGRKELALQTGVPETTIERILNFLENGHQIGQQKTTKYRLITIVKWDEYQKADSTSDNKRTTNGQQTDTNKNVKKNKNEKKILDISKTEVLQGKQWNELINAFEPINPMYQELYKNRTERLALTTLVEKIGYEKLLNTIKALPEIVGRPYAPRISKPTELKRDLGKLVIFYKQEQGKIKSNNILEI